MIPRWRFRRPNQRCWDSQSKAGRRPYLRGFEPAQTKIPLARCSSEYTRLPRLEAPAGYPLAELRWRQMGIAVAHLFQAARASHARHDQIKHGKIDAFLR